MSTRSDESGNAGPVSELLQNETVRDVVSEAIREYHNATVGLAASLDQFQRRSEEQREELWDAIYELRHELADTTKELERLASVGFEMAGSAVRLTSDVQSDERSGSSSGAMRRSGGAQTDGEQDDQGVNVSTVLGTPDQPAYLGPFRLFGEFREMSRINIRKQYATYYSLFRVPRPMLLELVLRGETVVAKLYSGSLQRFSRAMGMVVDGELEFAIAEPEMDSSRVESRLNFRLRGMADFVEISGEEYPIERVLREDLNS